MKRSAHFRSWLVGWLAVLLVMVTLNACHTQTQLKPTIAVSIGPQRYLLEQIVGDRFDVVCLLQEGANPEHYEPSISNMMALERCRAYMMIGHIGFETALLNRVSQNNPDLRVVDTSVGIDLIEDNHSQGCIDPHVWTSVRNALVIAQNMYGAVVELDGGNKDYYQRRYAALKIRLEQLDRTIAQKLVPMRGQTFLIWHPSLTYFARDYGLTQLSLEQEGKESSAASLQRQVELARGSGARLLFYQREFDVRQVETLASELGVTSVEINPMNTQWEKEMLHIANHLISE